MGGIRFVVTVLFGAKGEARRQLSQLTPFPPPTDTANNRPPTKDLAIATAMAMAEREEVRRVRSWSLSARAVSNAVPVDLTETADRYAPTGSEPGPAMPGGAVLPGTGGVQRPTQPPKVLGARTATVTSWTTAVHPTHKGKRRYEITETTIPTGTLVTRDVNPENFRRVKRTREGGR